MHGWEQQSGVPADRRAMPTPSATPRTAVLRPCVSGLAAMHLAAEGLLLQAAEFLEEIVEGKALVALDEP